MTSSVWCHVHVTEREVRHEWPDGQMDDGHWEDCLWCSVVEWLNDTYRNVPDSHAYAESLRHAAGEPPAGGSNFGDVFRAFTRLDIPVPVVPVKVSALLAALHPGFAGVATGNMANFPRGHRLRRFDPGFAAGHAWYIARLDNGKLVRCDPLAPKGTYNGEPISEAELRTFMGSTWTGVVRKVRVRPTLPDTSEEPMDEFSTYQHPSIAEAKVDAGLWTSSTFTGAPSIVVPKGDTKRAVGWPKGKRDSVIIIVHDRDGTVDGKSCLFGKPPEWAVAELP